MSTLQVETTGNITYMSGDLTFDFNEMMNELGDNPHCMFGDLNAMATSLIAFPGRSDVKEMGPEDMLDLFTNGITDAYYQDRDAFCYLCVRQSDLKNYMFSPLDSENRDNEYNRLRVGVRNFAKEGFKIYLMK